ncbi:MAG: type II toxin-antitoxin system HicA family toxin [bacterium]|nr:type II toxin-antitoxin system HicA family toxin [bacterium]
MPKLPGIPHQRAIRALERAGFQIVRQGKHVSMTKCDRIIVIPRANPINAFTMGGIIKDAGITIEEFKKLL